MCVLKRKTRTRCGDNSILLPGTYSTRAAPLQNIGHASSSVQNRRLTTSSGVVQQSGNLSEGGTLWSTGKLTQTQQQAHKFLMASFSRRQCRTILKQRGKFSNFNSSFVDPDLASLHRRAYSISAAGEITQSTLTKAASNARTASSSSSRSTAAAPVRAVLVAHGGGGRGGVEEAIVGETSPAAPPAFPISSRPLRTITHREALEGVVY